MNKLIRSKDRKVANLVTPNGKQASIANTFGLPAGKAYSCPSATSVCEKICYAGKLEKIFKGAREILMHNWNLLKDATYNEMYDMLNVMIADFRKDCERRDAPKLFRIHWDGDFFSDDYAMAWHDVILYNDDIQFWAYTRVASAAKLLNSLPNLSLYFSTDSDNVSTGQELRSNGVRLAYLAQNFAVGQAEMKAMTGRPAAKCPENNKQIPLISQRGSACVACGLCVDSKADIVFSASKK